MVAGSRGQARGTIVGFAAGAGRGSVLIVPARHLCNPNRRIQISHYGERLTESEASPFDRVFLLSAAVGH